MMNIYTTKEAAAQVGLTPQRIGQVLDRLREGVDYLRKGRTILITPKGIATLKERDSKPGRRVVTAE